MTFTTPYVTVNGIPDAIPTRMEYTSEPVANAYFNAILTFIAVLDLQPTASNPNPATQISSAHVNQVNAALFQLTNLSKYGVIITSSGQVFFPSSVVSAGYLAAHNLTTQVPPSAGKSSYTLSLVTMSMAQNYDAILRSLAAVGVNVNAAGNFFPSVSLTQLQQWRDLAIQVSSIANVVQAAELEGYGGSRTLQGIIEIDYVQTGNEIITRNMTDLKNALDSTQKILASLGQLQNIKNKLTFTNSAYEFALDSVHGVGNESNSPSTWSQVYQNSASAFFGLPVTPKIDEAIDFPGAGYEETVLAIVNLRTSLSAQVAILSSISPASALTDPTSLYTTIKKVLDDLNTTFVTSTGTPIKQNTSPVAARNGYENWMKDNYSAFTNPAAGTGPAGEFQQNITTAITAAESLNDTQKQTVRNFMFIFEEYYKSAAAALQAISQIIQKMAQNISR